MTILFAWALASTLAIPLAYLAGAGRASRLLTRRWQALIEKADEAWVSGLNLMKATHEGREKVLLQVLDCTREALEAARADARALRERFGGELEASAIVKERN